MNIDVLFLICNPRTASPLTEEIMDRFAERKISARVIRYGIMQKGLNGFLIVAVQGGTPADFLEIIKQDEDVSDYIVLDDDASAGTPGTEAQV
jgi:hypothetical protein